MARARRITTAPPARPRDLLWFGLAALLVALAGTAEERTFGSISDERAMLGTAVSLAEFAEIGTARGPLFTVHRSGGDAVSPYGMGQSFAEAPAAFLANGWERRFGAGASQTLFVATQLLLVALAALGAALAARALGAGTAGALTALFGTGLASPLWAYLASGYSEPLQGAALVWAFFLALRAVSRRDRLSPALAGVVAGIAVLAKGMNVVLVPLVLAPLLFPAEGRVRRLAAAAAGFTPPFVLFLALEIARFGRPFASYGGAGFTHPPLDGLWRLLVGPSKGIVFYFPLVLLAALGLARLVRARRVDAAAAAWGSFAVTLALASAWWAWDGTVGWGPRLLVPVVPLLAAIAGLPEGAGARRAAWVLGAAGFAVNALGVFQNEAATQAWVSRLPEVRLSTADARRLPPFLVRTAADGTPVTARLHVANADPDLSPLRLHLFLLRCRLSGADTAAVSRRAEQPPFAAKRPDLALGGTPSGDVAAALGGYLRSPFRWPHLFASCGRDRDLEAWAAAWDAALADQLLRAIDIGLPDRAVGLGERLVEITPSGYSAALYAEALRFAGRRETLASFLGTLPPEFRSSPSLGVVQALAARDGGDEATARQVLEAVARVFPRPALVAALARPLAEWPPTLHAMTGENLADRTLALPGVGK